MESLTLWFPAVASKKNRTQIRKNRKTGKRFTTSSDECKVDEKRLRMDAKAKILEQGGGLPLWPTQDVGIKVDYHARPGQIKVTIRPLAERRKGFTGRRRDLHGMLETIADALQGAAYKDDNQVAHVEMVRVLPEETKGRDSGRSPS